MGLLIVVGVVHADQGLVLPTSDSADAEAQSGSGKSGPFVHSRILYVRDYSDTFTERLISDRFHNRGLHALGKGSASLPIERNYGNRDVAWVPEWHFVTDETISSTAQSPYPGPSGRDSGSGLAELQHEGQVEFGLRYGLRDDFIVQFQAVQPDGWLAMAIGAAATQGKIGDPGALVVRFHGDGRISVGHGEKVCVTRFETKIERPWVWHNYGVRFDLDDKRLEFFVDEEFIGTVRFDELCEGMLNGKSFSPESVTVGASGGDRLWLDDFQIGAPFDIPYGPKFSFFAATPDAFGSVSSLSAESRSIIDGGAPPSVPPPTEPPVIPLPAALPAGVALLAWLAWRRLNRR